MADLKISQLPSAETLANTDLIPVKTTAGTKAITFENLKKSQEGYFKRVIDEYMAFDYEDLKALRDDGELVAGATYLLTDYQTVYQQADQTTPNFADKAKMLSHYFDGNINRRIQQLLIRQHIRKMLFGITLTMCRSLIILHCFTFP